MADRGRVEYMLDQAERALDDMHRAGAALRVVIAHLRSEIEDGRSPAGAYGAPTDSLGVEQ